MREIKFRAWNQENKEMIYINDFYWFEENCYHDTKDNNGFILMQYIGIKDKEGREIYEGDIFKDYGRLYYIKFRDYLYANDEPSFSGSGFVGIEFPIDRPDENICECYSGNWKDIVIIGNRFEEIKTKYIKEKKDGGIYLKYGNEELGFNEKEAEKLYNELSEWIENK